MNLPTRADRLSILAGTRSYLSVLRAIAPSDRQTFRRSLLLELDAHLSRACDPGARARWMSLWTLVEGELRQVELECREPGYCQRPS